MAANYPQIQVTPVVQAAAYAAGAVVGGLLTFPAVNEVSGSGLVQSATAAFASGVVPLLDLILLTQAPAGGTITDRVALAFAAADLAKVAGVIHLTDATLLGAALPSVMQGTGLALTFHLVTGRSLFGILVARSAVTLGAVNDVIVSLNVLLEKV